MGKPKNWGRMSSEKMRSKYGGMQCRNTTRSQILLSQRRDEDLNNQQEYLGNLIDEVIRIKDYDLSELKIALDSVKSKSYNKNNLSHMEEIIIKYKKLSMVDFRLDEFKRVNAVFKHRIDVVKSTFGYKIDTSEEVWNAFIQNYMSQRYINRIILNNKDRERTARNSGK